MDLSSTSIRLTPVISSFPAAQIEGRECLTAVFKNEPQIKPSPHPFFPMFRQADQLWNLFYQADLCDRFAKTAKKIQDLKIPPIPVKTIHGKKILQRLLESLKEVQTYEIHESILGIDLKVPIDLVTGDIFNNLLNKHPGLIQEILRIGSSAIPILGIEFYEYATICLFSDWFADESIKQWFETVKHLHNNANPRINDQDHRIFFNREEVEIAGGLCNEILNYVALQVHKLASSYFEKSFPYLLKPELSIEGSYLLSTSAIRNRSLVRCKKTRYGILAFNAKVPIDFSCVGLKEGTPTLKKLHLSSRQCIGIPQLKILASNSEVEYIQVVAEPFNVQAILDFLFNCSSPSSYDLDSWLHFLRKCTPMRRPDDENCMLKNLLLFFDKFIAQEGISSKTTKWWKKKEWLAKGFTLEEVLSNGGFLFLMLERDFKRIEKDCASLDEEPYFLAGFLFRACSSLAKASFFSDGDFKKLWEWVNLLHWGAKSFSSTLLSEITIALTEDKVPFSVLSAWINLVIWLHDPMCATIHCDQPVLNHQGDLLCIQEIHPIKDGHIILEYFAKNPFPESLKKIYAFIARKYPVNTVSFPLIDYFPSLEINVDLFKDIAKKYIYHPLPILNALGLQLYLTFYSLSPDRTLFAYMIQNLPSLLKESSIASQSQILKTLDCIFETYSKGNSHLTEQYSSTDLKNFNDYQWISELSKSGHSDFIYISYCLWKEKSNHDEKWLNVGEELLLNLSKSHFHCAVCLYKQIIPFLSEEKTLDKLLFLIQCYPSYPKKDIHSLGSLLEILRPYMESTYSFKNQDQEQLFHASIQMVIPLLLNYSRFQIAGTSALLRISNFNTWDKQSKASFLAKSIQQLLSEKGNLGLAAALYYFSMERQWLTIDYTQHFSLRFKAVLGEELLRKNHSSLSVDLLRHCFHKCTNDHKRASLYSWFILLLKNSSFKNIHVGDEKFFLFFLNIIPQEKRQKIHPLLISFYKNLILNLQQNRFPHIKDAIIALCDASFVDKRIKRFAKVYPQTWKQIFLKYFEISLKYPENRLSNLFELFQITVNLMQAAYQRAGKSKHLSTINQETEGLKQAEQLKLYNCLADLIRIYLAQPTMSFPEKIQKLIERHGESILHQQVVHTHIEQAESILLAMKRWQVPCKEFVYFSWVILKDHFARKQSPGSLLEYVDETHFTIMVNSASAEGIPVLNWLIEHLFFFPHRLLEGFKWIRIFAGIHAETIKENFSLLFLQQFKNKISEALISYKLSKDDLSSLTMLFKFFLVNEIEKELLLWKLLDNFPIDSEIEFIIKEFWESQKNAFFVCPTPSPIHAECLIHAFSCLSKIQYPDAIFYLSTPDWLPIFTFNPLVFPLLRKALMPLFSSLIKKVDAECLDWTLFDFILDQKKVYAKPEYFDVKNRDKKTREKWLKEIDTQLLKRILSDDKSLNGEAIKALSLLLESQTGYLLFAEEEGKVFCERVNTLCKFYIHLYNTLNKEDQEYLEQSLARLFSFVIKQKKISSDDLLTLIGHIQINELIVHKICLRPIVIKIIFTGTSKKISHLKPLVFSVLQDLLLQDYSLESDLSLQTSLQKIAFTHGERLQLRFLEFKCKYRQLKSPKEKEHPLLDYIQLFTETVPNFFSEIQYVGEAIESILSAVKVEGTKDVSKECLFEIVLTCLMDIEKQIDPQSNLSHDSFKQYYYLVLDKLDCFANLEGIGLDLLLLKYLKKEIAGVKCNLSPDKAKEIYERTIEKIEAISYYYPAIPYENALNENTAIFQMGLIQTVLEAYEKNIFSFQKDKLLMLELWRAKKIVKPNSYIMDIKPEHFEGIIYIIDRFFTASQIPYSFLMHIEDLLKTSLNNSSTEKKKRLLPYYQKFFSQLSTLELGRDLFINDIAKILINFSQYSLKMVSEKESEIKRELLTIFYDFCFQFLQEWSKDLTNKNSLMLIVECCTKMLSNQVKADIKENTFLYVKKMEFLMVFLKKIVIQNFMADNIIIRIHTKDFTKFVNSFVKTVMLIDSVNPSEKNSLLRKWLELLSQTTDEDDLSCVFDTQMISLIQIIAKNFLNPHWVQGLKPMICKTLDTAKWISTTHCVPSQKIILELLLFEWGRINDRQNELVFLDHLKQIIKLLPQIKGESGSIATLFIVYYYIALVPFTFNCGRHAIKDISYFFNVYLTCTQAIVEEEMNQSPLEIRSFLVFTTLKSFEATLFQVDNPQHRAYIEWVTPFISDKLCDEPSLNMYLLLYKNGLEKENVNQLKESLENLIPALTYYVVKTRQKKDSLYLVSFLKELYHVDPEVSMGLFLKWYHSFERIRVPTEEESLIFLKHSTEIFELYQEGIEKPIKQGVILNFFPEYKLPLKTFINSKKFSIKKTFLNYFKAKTF